MLEEWTEKKKNLLGWLSNMDKVIFFFHIKTCMFTFNLHKDCNNKINIFYNYKHMYELYKFADSL